MTRTNGIAQKKTVRKRVSTLKPSPENQEIYGPVKEDQDFAKLVASIRDNGLHDPLEITEDNYIVAGHRRLRALQVIGREQVFCKVLPVRRDSMSRDEYRALIRDRNLYRQKSAADQIREELVGLDDSNPVTRDSLLLHRYQSVYAPEWNGIETVAIEERKERPLISEEKADHVKYIKQVVFVDRREYWPLSDRAVHYALLNYTFMRNLRWWDKEAEKWVQIPYANDPASYSATCDLLMRLRLRPYESIPWEALDDPTRAVKEFHPFSNVKQFVSQEIDKLFDGYWRKLLQSQPNYVEVVCEKNTVYHMVLRVTTKYQVNTMSGRGFTSIDPWHDLYERYKASGKDRCIVIMLTDFDPAGERMVQCAGQTLRDDFDIAKLTIIKAGVTRKQVEKYNLPTQSFAKETDEANLKWFLARNNGDKRVWELEALEPEAMMSDLDEVIRNVIDIDLYNAEVAKQEEDEEALADLREKVIRALTGIGLVEE
jgi:hypothetical protein